MKKITLLTGLCLMGNLADAAELRVGIIGCDTSHATAFTETWNNPAAKGYVPGAKVVGAFPGGSLDIPESSNRLAGITAKLKEQYGVVIYDSIEALCQNVDVICLESLDGRPKLEQLKPILAARKPVYVDKPMAASLRDVIEMFKLAKAANVPIFTSSSLRFASNSVAARKGVIGKVNNAETFGPCSIEPHHPDLFWYGIHGTEALFTVMGTGCKTVQRGTTADGKIEVIGDWGRGRKGVFREDQGFRGVAKGAKGEMPVGSWDGYVPLVEEITKFFHTGIAPVKPEETIEIFAFMEAADESKRRGGAPVKLSDMIKRAKGKR
jgi:hypothetical protein